jgi:hypothetical protein
MSLKLISGVKLRFGSMHRIWWLSVGSGCCRRALSPWCVPLAAVFCVGGGALSIFYEIEEGQTCVGNFLKTCCILIRSARFAIVARSFQIIQTPWFVAGHFTTLWHDFLRLTILLSKKVCVCVCKKKLHIFSGKTIAALSFPKEPDRFLKASKKRLFTNYQDPEPR